MPDAIEVVEWWLEATTFDGFTGAASPPEWPFPGGPLRQPAKLVAAARVLRSEWPHIRRGGTKERVTSSN